MVESSLNFKNNSSECLEIMLQKYGNFLLNLEQFCRILVIMLQNIGYCRTSEINLQKSSAVIMQQNFGNSSAELKKVFCVILEINLILQISIIILQIFINKCAQLFKIVPQNFGCNLEEFPKYFCSVLR